jgi:hypothetical protein
MAALRIYLALAFFPWVLLGLLLVSWAKLGK